MTENKERIGRVNECINSTKVLIDQFILQANSLSTGKIINSTEDLIAVLHDPSRGFAEIIIGKIPNTEYGIPVNKHERFKTLSLPDLSELTESALAIRASAQTYGLHYLSGLYELDGDKAKINKEKKEEALDAYRTFATNQDEATFLDLQNDFVASYNKLRQHAAGMCGAGNIRERFDPERFEMSKFIRQDFTLNPQIFDEVKHFPNTLRG